MTILISFPQNIWSVVQSCNMGSMTYKEPHEGKYGEERDDEDKEDDEVAKGCVALKSDLA